MILIGIGGNLPHPPAATPRETAEAAVAALPRLGVRVLRRSRWYLSAPVPPSDQPYFVNGVIQVACRLAPPVLLGRLLSLEREFGRVRSVANAARTLDLDLLAYDSRICRGPALILPHPRLHRRRFVLAPLREVAPRWRHPILGGTAAALLRRLPPGRQPVWPID